MANELMNTFDSGTDIVTRASFNARIEQANTNFVAGNTELLGAMPNKNLLHNWDFRNPVNQRGQSSYSGNDAYTIDRWAIRTTNTTVEILSGIGLKISNSANISIATRLFDQILENPTLFAGKTLSYSVNLVETTMTDVKAVIRYVVVGGGVGNVVVDLIGNGIKTVSANIPSGVTEIRVTVVAYTISANQYVTISQVKLELGSVSTLANDPPADYGEQLALCQRYFYRINPLVNYGALASGQAQSATEARFAIIFPNKMRTTPTFSYVGPLRVNGAGTVFAISNVTAYEASNTSIRLSATVGGGMTAGWSVMLQNDGNTTAYVEFSADL